MEAKAKAKAKTIRICPTKVRLVARLIQEKNVDEALTILKMSAKKAARLLEKVLASAVANAVNEGASRSSLNVISATADDGPRLKRFRPAPRGSAKRIIKRTSHISVTVG